MSSRCNELNQSQEGELVQILPLKYEGESNDNELYLHLLCADGIWNNSKGKSLIRAGVINGDNLKSFGVFAGLTTGDWLESSSPNYMYNVEVTKGSCWQTQYYWPGSGRISFFAYAPYNASGVKLPEVGATGTPVITYSVPDDLANQNDLLAAKALDNKGNFNNSVLLTFQHILSAVRFDIGDNGILP